MASEQKAQFSSSASKRTNFLRVPSKPISQNVENFNYQIDVKNINVRQIQGSILKLREKQGMNEQVQSMGSPGIRKSRAHKKERQHCSK